MGMESFYVNIHFCNAFDQNELVGYLKKSFLVDQYYYYKRFLFFKGQKKYLQNEYIIDKFIIMSMDEGNKSITIKACFSNFNLYIDKIYKLISWINKKYSLTYDIGRMHGLSVKEIDIFKDNILDFYQPKYDDFMSKYGLSDIDLLPDEHFYTYVNNKKVFKQKSI